jgi:hypothetical protein
MTYELISAQVKFIKNMIFYKSIFTTLIKYLPMQNVIFLQN